MLVQFTLSFQGKFENCVPKLCKSLRVPRDVESTEIRLGGKLTMHKAVEHP